MDKKSLNKQVEYNRETGQYYYRARVYDSLLGRFTGKDPVGYPGYEYVRNNPMRYRDYFGEECKDASCSGGENAKYAAVIPWFWVILGIIVIGGGIYYFSGGCEKGQPKNIKDKKDKPENEIDPFTNPDDWCAQKEEECHSCCDRDYDKYTLFWKECYRGCTDFVEKGDCKRMIENSNGFHFKPGKYQGGIEGGCVKKTFVY